MPDLIHVHYATTGESTSTDAMGMREMQARACAALQRGHRPGRGSNQNAIHACPIAGQINANSL